MGRLRNRLMLFLIFFFDEYVCQKKLDKCHTDFGREWYLHLLYILNEKSLTEYALEKIAKNQEIVYQTILGKVPQNTTKVVWDKLISLLQGSRSSQLLYEAQLNSIRNDYFRLSCVDGIIVEEYYKVFNQIKANVTEPYNEHLADIISVSLIVYNNINKSLPENQQKPCLDLGTGQYTWHNPWMQVVQLVREKNYTLALNKLSSYGKHVSRIQGSSDIAMSYVHHLRGDCYMGVKDFDKAFESYEKAADISWNINAITHSFIELTNLAVKIATALHRKKQYKQCIEKLQKASFFAKCIENPEVKDTWILKCDIFKTLNLSELEDPEFFGCARSVLPKFSLAKELHKDSSLSYNIILIYYKWMESYYKLSEILEYAKQFNLTSDVWMVIIKL